MAQTVSQPAVYANGLRRVFYSMFHGNNSQKKHEFKFLLKFLFMFQQPLVGQGLLTVEVSKPRSDIRHSVGLLRASDRPDAETSTWQQKHSQETNTHGTGWIRTRNPSKRVVADRRLRPHGYWNRLLLECSRKKSPITVTVFRDVTKCSSVVGYRVWAVILRPFSG